MPNVLPAEAPATARCCSREHVGPRVLPVAAFYPSQLRKSKAGYCRECYREYKRQRDARDRGEVAADVGPDYTALAEAALFPGRAYATLTPAERWRAIEHARALATAAGVYPAMSEQARA